MSCSLALNGTSIRSSQSWSNRGQVRSSSSTTRFCLAGANNSGRWHSPIEYPRCTNPGGFITAGGLMSYGGSTEQRDAPPLCRPPRAYAPTHLGIGHQRRVIVTTKGLIVGCRSSDPIQSGLRPTALIRTPHL
jgi:hypothetical protein